MKKHLFLGLLLLQVVLHSCKEPLKPNKVYKESDFEVTSDISTTQMEYSIDEELILNSSLPLDSLSYPPVFEVAFETGASATQGEYTSQLSNSLLGHIQIPTGKIVVQDPISQEALAFSHKFPKGTFPIEIGHVDQGYGARTGFVRIRFSNSKIVKWEFARLPGQKALPIDGEMFYCFSVDAGTAFIADSSAHKALSNKGDLAWTKLLLGIDDGPKLHEVDEFNLASFDTGYGDGCYATYIGLDKDENICQLLCDFGMLYWN